jgi:NADH:ubiquinone reductase (non-electrogenic)
VRASPSGKKVRNGAAAAAAAALPPPPLTSLEAEKPVVLVLGSGWGSHALSKVVDTELFDVVVVSPTNHFCFTPMLPSAAVGTVEFRSVLEPVRVSNPTVTYLEAEADEVDLERKVARCTAAAALSKAGGEAEEEGGGEGAGAEGGRGRRQPGPRPRFEIAYDVIVFALGEQSATFGVPGVRENAYFLKTINDARTLRTRVGSLFEAASLPSTSEEERQRLLSFVVVGGGPTGVEFAGTLADYVRVDLARKFPSLRPTVTLLQSDKAILGAFSTSLQERALATLRSEGIDVKLGVRVMVRRELFFFFFFFFFLWFRRTRGT